VGALKRGDHVGLLTFTQAIWNRSPLVEDGQQVLAALDQPATPGHTSVIDATLSGIVLSESGSGRPLLIVFSDGLDTASLLPDGVVLETAKRSGAVVYAVEVANSAGSEFLRHLTELTGGRVLSVASTRNLAATFVSILDEFRQRYLLSYTPRGVAKPGWHQLEVRVRNRGAVVRARPGYVAR